MYLRETVTAAVREVFSFGRCGMGNLPSQGDVHEHPGPVDTLQTFWREEVTVHENARRKTCAFCFEVQSGRKLCLKRTAPTTKTAPAILQLLVGQRRAAIFKVLANIDMEMDTTPAIVCLQCSLACTYASRNNRDYGLSQAAIKQYSDARRCKPGVPCHLCVRLGERVREKKSELQLNEQTKAEKKEELTHDVGHKKQSGGGRKKMSARLDVAPLLMMTRNMNLTQRNATKMMKKMTAATTSMRNIGQMQQGMRLLPTIVDDFFDSKESDLCGENGSFVYCDKLSLYLSFIVYAVGKNNADVEYIKLNADEGQQRFQVMMQPLYYGDERKICGVVETSVYNVLLIASASQCVENIASTALLFNSLDLEQLDKDFPSAKIVFVCDMKMQNNLLGLGPCSCRYPMALTLFSQNPLYSDEYRLRTVRMIVDDVREYETAKREEEAEQLRAEAAGNERRRKKVSDSSFHSVRSEPINIWCGRIRRCVT